MYLGHWFLEIPKVIPSRAWKYVALLSAFTFLSLVWAGLEMCAPAWYMVHSVYKDSRLAVRTKSPWFGLYRIESPNTSKLQPCCV